MSVLPPRRGTVNINPSLMQQQNLPQNNLIPNQGYQSQPYISTSDQIRNNLNSMMGGVSQSGGFNWGRGGSGLVYDEALKSLVSGVDGVNPQDADNFYIERAYPGMMEFMKNMATRAGPFFEQYKQTRDQFRNIQRHGQNIPDPSLSAYVDALMKQADFPRILSACAMPMVGFVLVEKLKKSQDQQLTINDYMEAVMVACHNALYFEFVSWLMNSGKGREMLNMLAPEVKTRVNKLDQFKEQANQAFEFFGQTMPWSGLEFKTPKNTRVDFNTLYGAQNGFPDPVFDTSVAERYVTEDESFQSEAVQLVMRNARERKQLLSTGNISQHIPETGSTFPGDAAVNWNTVRKDWENLNPSNRDEFRTRRYFNSLGQDNLYVIIESDWRRVQAGYRKAPEQGREESVVKGSFRVVTLDLDHDTGWTSTIVRAEEYSMTEVLSDPSILLPKMEMMKEADFLNVNVYPVKEVTETGTLQVMSDSISDLGKGITLITVDEPIVTNNSKKLETTLLNVNAKLVGNLKGEVATSFNATNWDVFTCASETDRLQLFLKAPYLFKDGTWQRSSGEDEKTTFFQQVVHLSELNYNKVFDDDLMDFVNTYLTEEINNWLVNVGGYDVVGKNTLAVDDAFEEIRELSEYLKQHDRKLFGVLHDEDTPSALKRAMKLFTFHHSSLKEEDGESESLLAGHEEELDLHAERQFFIAVINNRQGPIVDTDNGPVTIKRSKFPEYFDLVEKAFPSTMGAEMDMEEVDKILFFEDSRSLWAFNYSAFDRNVATLRHVSRRKQLVLMQFS